MGVRESESLQSVEYEFAMGVGDDAAFLEENMHQKFVWGVAGEFVKKSANPIHTLEIIASLAIYYCGNIPHPFVQIAVPDHNFLRFS